MIRYVRSVLIFDYDKKMSNRLDNNFITGDWLFNPSACAVAVRLVVIYYRIQWWVKTCNIFNAVTRVLTIVYVAEKKN